MDTKSPAVNDPVAIAGGTAHRRPGAWRAALPLRLRLALLVSIVVAAVVGIEAFLEIHLFERRVEADLMESATAAAQAVSDDIELRGASPVPSEVSAVLREFLVATPAARDIAALIHRDGALRLIARTPSPVSDDVTHAAQLAFERRQPVWTGEGRLRTVAVPITRDGRVVGAVTVIASFGALEQLTARGRQMALIFALPAIVALTLLVDLLARRLIHKPIAAISATMARAGAGDVSARAPVGRPDEIGAVAKGLNEMLGRIEHFQGDLQARVEEARTELIESNLRILALREELVRAEQMAVVGQMAANVAHQIGTPLNLISGHVQVMIEEESACGGRALARLQTMQGQITKVAAAVRGMLDAARRPKPRREAVDLRALLEQVCEISGPALRASGVGLRIDVKDALPAPLGDPLQLELACLNLISNALDAMPGGGRLEIVASRTLDGVRLLVSDTGTGIPAGVLPRVFEPWVTTKPPGRGTGLGLSITREVITSHGGTIAVRNNEGGGTTFVIELPADGASAPVGDS
jgi:signal transduction histidine kinase